MSSFSTPLTSPPRPNPPRLPRSKSFFNSQLVEKIWSPDRNEPRKGDPLRADPEASPPLFPRESLERCAPSPCAGSRPVEPRNPLLDCCVPKGHSRAEEDGENRCVDSPGLRLGAQRLRLQTGESGGWAELWDPGTRAADPGAGVRLNTPWRGAPTAAVEVVRCVAGRTGAGALEGLRAPQRGHSCSYQHSFLFSQPPSPQV